MVWIQRCSVVFIDPTARLWECVEITLNGHGPFDRPSLPPVCLPLELSVYPQTFSHVFVDSSTWNK